MILERFFFAFLVKVIHNLAELFDGFDHFPCLFVAKMGEDSAGFYLLDGYVVMAGMIDVRSLVHWYICIRVDVTVANKAAAFFLLRLRVLKVVLVFGVSCFYLSQ